MVSHPSPISLLQLCMRRTFCTASMRRTVMRSVFEISRLSRMDEERKTILVLTLIYLQIRKPFLHRDTSKHTRQTSDSFVVPDRRKQ